MISLVDVRCRLLTFVFIKQKTAYEMRISDWSSDVCSSDLALLIDFRLGRPHMPGNHDQCHIAQQDAGGDGRADLLAGRACRCRDQFGGDHQQDHPCQDRDPARPGTAPQGQFTQFGEQCSVVLGTGSERDHDFRALSALPARLAPLWPRWPDSHWPISTTASRSTPVCRPCPLSMYSTSSVATLPV